MWNLKTEPVSWRRWSLTEPSLTTRPCGWTWLRGRRGTGAAEAGAGGGAAGAGGGMRTGGTEGEATRTGEEAEVTMTTGEEEGDTMTTEVIVMDVDIYLGLYFSFSEHMEQFSKLKILVIIV